MSKRMLTLFTLVLTLVVFSVAQAQLPTVSDEPAFVLTEEQINAEFRIPNTASRRISNLEVDVQEDGLHVSFQMTVTRNGTTTTYNIIAILIGLFDQPHVSALELENTLISNFIAPRSLRQEVTNVMLSSWNNYEEDVLLDAPDHQVPAEGIIMSDGRICNPRWGC